MTPRLAEAIEWLESHIDDAGWATRTSRTGPVELSLTRIRALVAALGDPQRRLRAVHITGTNGKGSTAAIITRLAMAEGLRVGTYTSPHVSRYNERVRVDDVEIDDARLADVIERAAAAEATIGTRCRPFELLTAAALTHFVDRSVDVAVIEVGVLGRYDATNVVDADVAVVTNIGFDHTSGEGDWRLRIAAEKAGIVKQDAVAIVGPLEARLVDVVAAQGPRALWRFGYEITVTRDIAVPDGRQLFVGTPLQAEAIALPMHGTHQSVNAALGLAATAALLGRAVSPLAIRSGLAAVNSTARAEQFPIEAGRGVATVVLDRAHNPDAAAALTRTLRDDLVAAGRRLLVLGVLGGRDVAAMVRALDVGRYDVIVACSTPTVRGVDADALAAAIHGHTDGVVLVVPDAVHAIERVVAEARHGDQVVVTGSTYHVGAVRDWLVARTHTSATAASHPR